MRTMPSNFFFLFFGFFSSLLSSLLRRLTLPSGEIAQLSMHLEETERTQARTLVQLEKEQTQLEAEKAEIRALNAKTAEIEAETVKIKAETAAQLAAIEEKEKRLVVDQRRLKAWKRDFQGVKTEWKASITKILAQRGVQSINALPEEEQDKILDDIFDRSEAIDPGCFRNMFSNPFDFIEEPPKPLKQPDNPLHRLLEQGVAQRVITAEELEEVVCPISYQVMLNPVKSTDSLHRTYDRSSLENIYYALPGTYPFDRSEMTVDPTELPPDEICYGKIQNLIKRCQTEQIAFLSGII